ncbi:glycosyltransferase family 22 protein [Peniophora sp. CONT]|nr:glycosyltransferase family 22 protein [Peniophora sp. CONT]
MQGVQEVRFKRPLTEEKKDAAPKLRHTGILQDQLRRTAKPPFVPSFSLAVRILLLARVTAAMFSNISDCDEVFNFWEPLHYLDRGYGFQTWETSPAYGIRSWAYIILHYIPAKVLSWTIREDGKRAAFFTVRILLAVISTLCEAKLFDTVRDKINNRVARYFLVYLFSSAGLWNASAAFLPSTFVMYATTLAYAYAFVPAAQRLDRRTLVATVSFAAGAVIGWPFALVCAVPFVFEEMFVFAGDRVQAAQRPKWMFNRWTRLAWDGFLSLQLVIPVFAIDTYFYGEQTIVPWNIVKYNVFPDAERGPGLYGTEPWYFYIFNLLLNFNIVLPLALMSLPALALTYRVDRKRLGYFLGSPEESSPYTMLGIRLTPVYIWFAIMTAQAHKEERFMFPIYPLLCFNAAVSTYLIRGWLEVIFVKITKSPYRASQTSIFSRTTLCITLVPALFSLARIMALWKYYHAPMQILYRFQYEEGPLLLNATGLLPTPLPPPELLAEFLAKEATRKKRSDEDDERLDLGPLREFGLRICYGKEWYTFPGHYLVPDGVRVDWIKSEFDGMLPAHFAETIAEAGLPARVAGTSVVPQGLNDRNIEEPAFYVPVSECDYLIDLDFPEHPSSSPNEPRYAVDSEHWSRQHCVPFLDARHSPLITRMLWFPGENWASSNSYGDYCLLRNTASVEAKIARVKAEVDERKERVSVL